MQTSVAYEESHVKELASRADRRALPDSRSWVCLAIAAVLLLFSNGANNVPFAAWLAPVFMLRFVRRQSLRVGLPVAYVVLVAAFAFQFRGMVPIPGVAYYIVVLVLGISLVLPYFIDRLVAHKLSGLTASLVFPTAWAATEYVLSRGPYATWGSAAYSQYGNLALLQVLSLTGLWGITFLIGWFAAVCNWLWEKGLDSKGARGGARLCVGTIAAVMLLGGARMALFPPSSQTVRVTSISRRNVQPELSQAVAARMFQGKATSPELAAGIRRVKGAKRLGVRIGNWLTLDQSRTLLRESPSDSLRGKRDRAILALLVGRGLRRAELAGLETDDFQVRKEHWVIADLIAKGKAYPDGSSPGVGETRRG